MGNKFDFWTEADCFIKVLVWNCIDYVFWGTEGRITMGQGRLLRCIFSREAYLASANNVDE